MAMEKSGSARHYTETDPALCQKFLEAGFGSPSQGEVFFSPLEAAYLAKIGKTSVRIEGKGGSQGLFGKSQKAWAFQFAVYCLARGAGRVVRPIGGTEKYFRAYAPGVGREENRPSILICLLPGKMPPLSSLAEEVKIAHRERLDLVIACGTAKEPRFYKISSFNF